jgi:hypothetical protein
MSKNSNRKAREFNQKQKQKEESYKGLRLDRRNNSEDPDLDDFFKFIIRRKQEGDLL